MPLLCCVTVKVAARDASGRPAASDVSSISIPNPVDASPRPSLEQSVASGATHFTTSFAFRPTPVKNSVVGTPTTANVGVPTSRPGASTTTSSSPTTRTANSGRSSATGGSALAKT